MALDFLTGFCGWRPSKLSFWDPVATRGFMVLLHLILVTPVGLAATGSLKTYRFMGQHPELSDYPYNEKVKLSYFLTCLGCMTLLPWIFVSTVLFVRFSTEWILAHGIANLGLFIVILIGAVFQAQFLPATSDGCEGSKAYNWQVKDGHQSFFTAIALIKKNDSSYAEGSCKDLVGEWTTVCAVLFFQAALVYFSVFSDGREFSILNPFRPFFWGCVIVLFPFVLIIQPLKGLILPRIRLWRSLARKGKARSRKEEVAEIPLQTRFKPGWNTFNVPDTKLMEILHIEHILLNVVQYIHSEDLINFSLTCRAVREAVYPRNDLHFRVPKLDKYCCNFGTSTKCIYCNTKLCPTCVRAVSFHGLPGHRHNKCVPYCKDCYYTTFARHPRGYKRPCKCYVNDKVDQFQDCCRKCAEIPLMELEARRQLRYEQECRSIANSTKECGKCAVDLKPGARWWKCVKCGGECRAKIHPGYVGKVREDVERGIDGSEVGWWAKLGFGK